MIMIFAVVEFTSKSEAQKELAVVPLTWIIKNERRCYWPTRTNKVPLSTFIKQYNPPNKHWPHYLLKKIHFKTESYDLAEQRLETLIEEHNKRDEMSEASRRDIPSDADESTDSSEEENMIVKKPLNNAEQGVSSDYLRTQQPLLNLPTPSLSSTSTMTLSDAFDNDIIIADNHDFSLNEVNQTAFQTTVLSSLAKLESTNEQLLITMQEILRFHKKIAVEKLIAPENLPNFPLKTYDDFVAFENLIKEDATLRQYMVRKLASLGGSDVEGRTRRIIKFIIDDQLGIQFNWKGRHHKIPFEHTSVMTLIYDAAKLNIPMDEKNDYKVAWAVKEWLKHSATRLNHLKKK